MLLQVVELPEYWCWQNRDDNLNPILIAQERQTTMLNP